MFQLDALTGWYIASVLLFTLEVFGMSGFGLFFLALGALVTGLVLDTGLIASDAILAQTSIFLLSSGMWMALLWYPLKRWKNPHAKKQHQDMVGRFAVVAGDGLESGKTGQARWSGTVMSARLSHNSKLLRAEAGTEMKITAVEGIILILSEKE